MATSTIQAFFETASRRGEAIALCYHRGGRWCTLSWSDYAREVRRVSRALIALGVQRGQSIAIVGPNTPEWLFADLGALAIGAVPAPIYPTLTAEQTLYVAAHSEAVVAFAFAGAVAKLGEQTTQLPALRRIVSLSRESTFVEAARPGQTTATGVLGWEAFLALGDAVADSEIEARLAATSPRDLATLIYTSGTTGPPKAVMISHDNLMFVAETALHMLQAARSALPPGAAGQSDSGLSYLPLSHIAEQLLSLHLPALSGLSLTLCEKLEELPAALRNSRPTIFFGVPRVWEKLQARIEEQVRLASPLRQRLLAWARSQAVRAQAARDAGRPPPLGARLAQKLVLSKLQARLGLDRAQLCATGAAKLSRETLDFFGSLDLRLFELYGLSESTGLCTSNRPDQFRAGTVGTATAGAEVKLAPDGEILTRGRHVFLGYLKDAEATRDALDDAGFLRTGDIGELDADGFLRITDRKKDLLVTSGGKNVSPQNLEGKLARIRGIAQAVVVGEARKHLAALFTLDRDAALSEARVCGSSGTSIAELSSDPRFIARIDAGVQAVNATLAPYETIKRFRILPGEFTIESGELTPTMKLKRKLVSQRYAQEIAALFQETR